MSWHNLILGFLVGVWLTYWIMGMCFDLKSARHVFAYGLVAVGSALLTRLMIGA
jgi:hypothetical protein